MDAITLELVITSMRVGDLDLRIDIIDNVWGRNQQKPVRVGGLDRKDRNRDGRSCRKKQIHWINHLIIRRFGSFDSLESSSRVIYELSSSLDIYRGNFWISLRVGSQENLGVGEFRYIVIGIELGEAIIILNSGQLNTILSDSAAVQDLHHSDSNHGIRPFF